MAKRFGTSVINKAMKIGLEYTTLNIVNQSLNSLPNIPPIVKTISGLTTAFASYEILKSATKLLPANMRGIATVIIDAQSLLLGVQQIPNLISAIQSFSATSGGAGTTSFLTA